VPEEVNDDIGHIHLPEGTYKVNGNQALDYVRVRHDIGAANGDIGRMKRQQAFIAAMAHQVLSANTLARPDRLLKFLDASTQSLQLDEGLGSLVKIAKLGVEFKNIGLDNIQFITVPWQYAPDDPNRIRWLPESEQVWQAMINDKPLAPRFLDDAISAEHLPGSPTPTPTPTDTASPSGSPTGTPSSPGTPSSTPSDVPTEEDTQEAIDNGLCA